MTPPRTKTRTKARDLDQFYTRADVAATCAQVCLDVLRQRGVALDTCFFVEPSAGTGAFLDAVPAPKLGLDLEPGRSDIEQADFTTWDPTGRFSPEQMVVAIGNPPFGKNSSLALAFVNRCAMFADYVAFILPRTFEKASLQAKLDPHLHLIHEVELAADSFVHDGQPYTVPVVFQIWARLLELRPITARAPLTHPDFQFVQDPTEADFAFQRVGAAAGKVSVEGLRKAPPSHYFIKVNPDVPRDVQAILADIDWTEVKHRTAGNPSIGKRELVELYEQAVTGAS